MAITQKCCLGYSFDCNSAKRLNCGGSHGRFFNPAHYAHRPHYHSPINLLFKTLGDPLLTGPIIVEKNHSTLVACAAAGSNGSSTSLQVPSISAARAQFIRTVAPTALALMLCNMDRICLSVAMVPIAQQLGWAEGVQGVVQSAFLWGYLANQLIGGSFADRYGGKVVMSWGIASFSIASMLLPLVAITPFTAALGVTLPAVLASRFLVGLGEGVALPSMNNIIATRIEPSRRATALGGAFLGFHSGNLVGLLFSPIILHRYGWQALFYVFGVLGMPLLLIWNAIVPPPPVCMPQTGAPRMDGEGARTAKEERERVSIWALLRNKHVWAIIAANFVNHWGYFIYLNWMPTYFYKVLGTHYLLFYLPGVSLKVSLKVSLICFSGFFLVVIRWSFFLPIAALCYISHEYT